MQVRGHSIEEQWDLIQQFEGVVEHGLSQVVETWLAGLGVGSAVTAAAGDEFAEGEQQLHSLWNSEVQGVFTTYLTGTSDAASLAVAHEALSQADLAPGLGVPGVPDDFTADFVKQISNKMVGVSDDLWANIRDQLAQGVAAGEDMEQLANRARTAGSITMPRALTVARTTVIQASNAGSFAQANLLAGEVGMKKTWVATEDMRTRPDHHHADGQVVAMNAPFIVGGWPLMYPGDPNGPAGEVINCRCTLVYSFEELATVCECGTLIPVEALSAAAKLTAPMGASCICPAVASLTPTGYASKLTKVYDATKKSIYANFQSGGKISPAWGGAKIHSRLQDVMSKYPGLIGPNDTEALLDLIDEQYAAAGGKTSFKAKYEEWLNSPAGKKVVPTTVIPPAPVAVPPTVAAATIPYLDLVMVYSKIKNNFKVFNDLDAAINAAKFHAKSYISEEGQEALSLLTNDDLISSLKQYGDNEGYDTSWLAGGSPTTSPVAPISPTVVATPATGSVDLLDISNVPTSQVLDLYQKFKALKPITPNWKGAAIFKNLQALKPTLGPEFAGLNDGQLLKMLDQAYGASAGKSTYYDETVSWLKTPNGKKYLQDNGLMPPPEPGVGTSAPVSVTAPVTTPVAPPVTPSVPLTPAKAFTTSAGDISGVPSAAKQIIFNKIKSQGVYLTSTGDKIWDAIKYIKVNVPEAAGLNDLQLVRILDEVSASKAGLTNAGKYEEKLVKWLKTPNGKNHALGIKPPPKPATPKYSYGSPSPSSGVGGYSSSDPFPVAPINRPIVTHDETYTVLSNAEAHAMQEAQVPWTVSQRAALKKYTGSAYTDMNTMLRKGGTYDAATVKAVEQAQLGMRPSTRPMLLHRGTSFAQFGFKSGATEDQLRALIGEIREDKGFMSTSVGGSAAFSGQVQLEFQVPTGTPMAYLKPISHYSSENEMLLAAGTRYRIMDVIKVSSYQYKVILRVVP